MNRACFITRFHYPKNSPSFPWRFEYYKKSVLPRLLDQGGADIAVWCEDHHEHLFAALSDRIITFKAECVVRRYKGRYFSDFTPWEKVRGLPQYDIQIGLDSDDLIEPGFVDKVLEICNGDQSIHIGFQPLLLDVQTGKKYRMKTYTERNGSAIFAIYQPNKSDYIFAYEYSHRILPRLFERRVIVPEGYCFVSVHPYNDSTSLKAATAPINDG